MIIDLCSGLGRWPTSEPVVKVDFDPKTKPDIIADIRYLPLRAALKPDLVHASPPCRYFSVARQRRYGHDHRGIAESLELVAACFRAFHHLRAKAWTLENPVGFLSRLLNETRITYQVYDFTEKRTAIYSSMKSLRRSIIPQDVRQKILDAAL